MRDVPRVDSALRQMSIQRGVVSHPRSPDHSLAGVFYFPDVTFVLVQLPGGSHR